MTNFDWTFFGLYGIIYTRVEEKTTQKKYFIKEFSKWKTKRLWKNW